MRYVAILLVGILLGGGAAVFFLGTPPAKSAPGQTIKPPDQNGAQPGAVVIALEQSFIDAVLATTFSGLGTPTFQLGQSRNGDERIEQALFQGGCTNSITLLAEGSGVKTGVQFRNGNVYAPLAFTGSLTSPAVVFSSRAGPRTRLDCPSIRRSRRFTDMSTSRA